MTPIRVASTGGSGSIGRHLGGQIAAFDRGLGLQVELKTRLDDDLSSMIAELEKGLNLTHRLALIDRDSGDSGGAYAFVHLAALTSVRECEGDPARAALLNVDGALNWMRAAGAVGACRRFIFVSTSHVFRPTAELEFLHTQRTPDAQAVYGRTKAEAEKRLSEEANRLGIPLTIARVFSVIGQGMRPGFLYPELERRARDKDFSPLPGYKNVRDFIEAQAAAKVLCGLAFDVARQRSATGLAYAHANDVEIVHVCTGEPRSVRELAITVLGDHGLNNRDEFASMFPEHDERPNYLVSKPETRVRAILDGAV